MTWLSGSCQTPQPATGQQLISTDAYPEPIVITDAEVRADEADRDADEHPRPAAEPEQERKR